jgi:hypothetical protein
MKRYCTVTLGLLSALAGCGGGGDGGGSATPSSPPSQTSQPPQNLDQNLESASAPAEPFNIPLATMTMSSGGNSCTAIYSETPNSGTTMFDGQEANSSTISLTITENGSPPELEWFEILVNGTALTFMNPGYWGY